MCSILLPSGDCWLPERKLLGVVGGLAGYWVDHELDSKIVGLIGYVVAVIASRIIRISGPGLGDARNRLFRLDTIFLS